MARAADRDVGSRSVPAVGYEGSYDVLITGPDSRHPQQQQQQQQRVQVVSRLTGRVLKTRGGRVLLYGRDGARRWVNVMDLVDMSDHSTHTRPLELAPPQQNGVRAKARLSGSHRARGLASSMPSAGTIAAAVLVWAALAGLAIAGLCAVPVWLASLTGGVRASPGASMMGSWAGGGSWGGTWNVVNALSTLHANIYRGSAHHHDGCRAFLPAPLCNLLSLDGSAAGPAPSSPLAWFSDALSGAGAHIMRAANHAQSWAGSALEELLQAGWASPTRGEGGRRGHSG